MKIADMNWAQVEAYVARDDRAVLPIGSTEQHAGLSLCVDYILSERVSVEAAEPLGVPVYPGLPYGMTPYFMAYPGTVSLSTDTYSRLMRDVLDSITAHGFKRILIVNGHGGNSSLLPYFAQTQLDKPHDYVVYVFDERTPEKGGPPKKTKIDMHAGESETSKMMIARPDLVHEDRATSESGADQARQKIPEGVYTGIWWYTRFPNHYSGEGAAANKELGEYQQNWWVNSIVTAVKAVKADDVSPKLQQEFYEKSTHPLDTQP